MDDATESAAKQLAAFFHRNGYVRRQNPKRLAAGDRKYKKGDEIRLTARSKSELQLVRRLLAQAGFKCGRPYVHVNQWRQPVYGRAEVARFLVMVGEKRNKGAT
jgi:hypothetical protein